MEGNLEPMTSQYSFEYEDADQEYDETTNVIQNSADVEFLKEDEFQKDRDKIIFETMDNLCLNRDETILVLLEYNWSTDKLLTDWYENVERNRVKCGIDLDETLKKKLALTGGQVNGDSCWVCEEEKNPDFWSLNCGHQFCRSCWTEYLIEKLKDPLTLLTSKCLQKDCTCVVYETFFIKCLQYDKLLFSNYMKAVNKNFTDQNEDIRWCPNPKCCISIKTSNHIARDITCLCGITFCYKCSQESHRPCTCYMASQWDKKSRSENLDTIWWKANTKTCPHCKMCIQKIQGCNYMLCDKKVSGCGKAFCYVCETDWEKHTQEHFQCNKYTEQVKDKEKQASDLKQISERYEFYFNRHINYRQGVNLVNKNLREKWETKKQILLALHNFPWIELNFIDEAWEAVIKGKICLKNTYIYGYYMKNNNYKTMFEFTQGYLEKNADNLNMLLEHDSLDQIIQQTSYNECILSFKDFKNKVINLTVATLKYIENILTEIENQYSDSIDEELLEAI